MSPYIPNNSEIVTFFPPLLVSALPGPRHLSSGSLQQPLTGSFHISFLPISSMLLLTTSTVSFAKFKSYKIILNKSCLKPFGGFFLLLKAQIPSMVCKVLHGRASYTSSLILFHAPPTLHLRNIPCPLPSRVFVVLFSSSGIIFSPM